MLSCHTYLLLYVAPLLCLAMQRREKLPVQPHVHHGHAVDSQRPRLVRREQGDRPQGVHRGEVFDQNVGILQPHRGEGQKHGHGRRQSLRNKRHEKTWENQGRYDTQR